LAKGLRARIILKREDVVMKPPRSMIKGGGRRIRNDQAVQNEGNPKRTARKRTVRDCARGLNSTKGSGRKKRAGPRPTTLLCRPSWPHKSRERAVYMNISWTLYDCGGQKR